MQFIKMWICTSGEFEKDAFIEEKFIRIYSIGRCRYKHFQQVHEVKVTRNGSVS